MSVRTSKKIWNSFFYGNFFAGLCAVALSIETNVQHGLALNGIHFYTIIFLGTTYYYTFLYLKEIPNQEYNERVSWYKKNQSLLKISQLIIKFIFLQEVFHIQMQAVAPAAHGVGRYVDAFFVRIFATKFFGYSEQILHLENCPHSR